MVVLGNRLEKSIQVLSGILPKKWIVWSCKTSEHIIWPFLCLISFSFSLSKINREQHHNHSQSFVRLIFTSSELLPTQRIILIDVLYTSVKTLKWLYLLIIFLQSFFIKHRLISSSYHAQWVSFCSLGFSQQSSTTCTKLCPSTQLCATKITSKYD